MDSENNYKAEDFLSDGIPKDKEHLISESERDLAENIRSVVKASGKEQLSGFETDLLWGKIQSRARVTKTSRLNWKRYLQIAAVLLVVMTIGLWQINKNSHVNKLVAFATQNVNEKALITGEMPSNGKNATSDTVYKDNEKENIIATKDFNTLVVGTGQRSVITLPDSTKVWLNSGSRLTYPSKFARDSRDVYLEGEAYFDVTHDVNHPFYVRSKEMSIKVLGTEFYVSSNHDSEDNYAVLVNGSIAFSTGSWFNKTEAKLVPGERINYNPSKNKLLISQVKTEEFQSWKEGYVNINSESLDIIAQMIARYYNIEISSEGLDLSGEKFSGRLDFQQSADDVLDILCLGTPYQYNAAERRLELRKR